MLGASGSLWLSAMQWFAKDWANALDTWRDALLYGGFGNPFVYLRRGQVLFELGDEKEASNELMRALLLGGEDVFSSEPLDYWVFRLVLKKNVINAAWGGTEFGSGLAEQREIAGR